MNDGSFEKLVNHTNKEWDNKYGYLNNVKTSLESDSVNRTINDGDLYGDH